MDTVIIVLSHFTTAALFQAMSFIKTPSTVGVVAINQWGWADQGFGKGVLALQKELH